MKKNYVALAIDTFEKTYSQILTNVSKQTEVNEKPKIYLDFANGSGAVSFAPYRKTFEKFFHCTLVNDREFSKPNLYCGA